MLVIASRLRLSMLNQPVEHSLEHLLMVAWLNAEALPFNLDYWLQYANWYLFTIMANELILCVLVLSGDPVLGRVSGQQFLVQIIW